MGAKGKKLWGQLLWGTLRLPITFWQQVWNKTDSETLLGDDAYEITPIDEDAFQVKKFELSAAAVTFIEDYFESFPGTQDIRLPLVMTACTVTYEKGGGPGDYDETGIGAGRFSGSVNGSAQASAFCIPKLSATVPEIYSDNLPVKHCFFFLAVPSMTNILAKLTAELGVTVLEWPAFAPESHDLTLTGERVQASAKVAFSTSPDYVSIGSGESVEHSPVIQREHLPATLHAAFTFTALSTQSYSATGTMTLGGSISKTATATATGRVSPSSLAATSPTALPASGLYLYKPNVEPSNEFGYFFVHAIVFDFASLP